MRVVGPCRACGVRGAPSGRRRPTPSRHVIAIALHSATTAVTFAATPVCAKQNSSASSVGEHSIRVTTIDVKMRNAAQE